MSKHDQRAPLTFVICGAGGAGKGSIVARLVELDETLWLSRSWTTREQRPGESDNAYVYVSRDEFDQHIRQGGFLEWAQFFENRYGTPVPVAPSGSDVVLEIDVQGALQVREVDPAAVVVLVLPPNRSEQRRRMQRRGDTDDHVAKRLAKSDAEEDVGRVLADLVVVNDDLDRTVAEVAELIEGRRADCTPRPI
ncbi:MAG: guanylate kinase [Actinobacteria bacterium]|nr:guanylate kinase [Actinomycetota bacterium]